MGNSESLSDNSVEGQLQVFLSSQQPSSSRVKAAHQLAQQLGNPTVLSSFLACLRQETDVNLLTQVIAILGKRKIYGAIETLLDFMRCEGQTTIEKSEGKKKFKQSDAGMKIRAAAAKALGQMEDDQAVLPMIGILSDPDENYRVRLAVAESLGRLGAQNALKPLVDIVQDEQENSQYLKESAVKALGMLGDIRALDPLLDVFESKKGWLNKFSFIKEQLIEAIGKIGTPDNDRLTKNLLDALNDRASYIRLAAVESLGEVGDERIVPNIIGCLFDAAEDVATAAVHALFQIGGESLIRQVLSEQDNLPQFVRDELEAYVP